MRKKTEIILETSEDGILNIKRDKFFKHLFGLSYSFHKNFLESTNVTRINEGKTPYSDTPEFLEIINKLGTGTQEFVSINKKDAETIKTWLECMCQMLLEIDSIDYKDKDIKKFFKLSENFLEKLKKYS